MRNVEDKMQNAKLWKAVEQWVKCIMRKFAVCQRQGIVHSYDEACVARQLWRIFHN